jgi:hypothetical protein
LKHGPPEVTARPNPVDLPDQERRWRRHQIVRVLAEILRNL